MALLLDVFGFLSVVLRGLVVTGQSLTLGGIAFLVLLARPLAAELGADGETILQRSRRLLRWSAMAFAIVEAVSMAIEAAILADSLDLPLSSILGASFVLAGLSIVACAAAIALVSRSAKVPSLVLFGLAVTVLFAQTLSSHAAARIDDRVVVGLAEALHQAAAAVWIGGIPYFLIALHRSQGGQAWRRVGKRFSQMSMASVAVLVPAGVGMAVLYTGSLEALYGTSYGIMLGGKVALLCILLLLGGMNFLSVERLRHDPLTPILRLKRFAEVEIGIGITVFFAAASLTSLPPAVDLAASDRATLSEVVERLTPMWPRLSSPDHADLAIPELQAKLDAASAQDAARARAFVPGTGVLPPRNAEDIAWSEYNHHWAGLIVLAIGILSLAERSGRAGWARNWPLLFLVLAGFLFFRSDPETWPLGDVGFVESFRDPEVLQHRIFVILIIGFAIFEWRIRTGRSRSTRSAYVFPLITAVGGALLLTHSHALSNLKDQMLIEMSHVPLAILGVVAGWARWLELRLNAPGGRAAAWVWPVCFTLVGLVLLGYREA